MGAERSDSVACMACFWRATSSSGTRGNKKRRKKKAVEEDGVSNAGFLAVSDHQNAGPVVSVVEDVSSSSKMPEVVVVITSADDDEDAESVIVVPVVDKRFSLKVFVELLCFLFLF